MTFVLPEYPAWPWWRTARSLLALGVITVYVVIDGPAGGWTLPGVVIVAVTLPLAVAGWLVWLFAAPPSRLIPAGIGIGAAAGLILSVVAPNGPALALPAVACAAAARRLGRRWALGLTAALSIGYIAGRLLYVKPTGWVLAAPAAFLVAMLVGLIRAQAARLAAQTQHAREEQARATALSEQARLAREIHDVLAHALSALSVQLETADALLESGRTEQGRQCVLRAGRLAREGLAETRRAIGTLRGETLPLPQLLDDLAAQYRADLDAPGTVRIEGEPRELDADAALALYRTAQEAMTNVRKHAPGAPVMVDLRYAPRTVSLTVVNGQSPAAVVRTLVNTGGGYGLTGLRERAELAGGRFTAGRSGDGYRVELILGAGETGAAQTGAAQTGAAPTGAAATGPSGGDR